MNIRFKTLSLQCRQSKEVLDLQFQILFFHGKVSSGKSSIARLIDFCFGGELEKTPAITKELVSVSLELTIEEYNVLLERQAESNQVRVTWMDLQNQGATVLAPVAPGAKPVWSKDVFSLSDMMFHLMNIGPLKVPTNKNLDDAKLTRLSIRNFMWYCYLDQHHLDSSFYRLEDVGRYKNSREVMRFVFRHSSQRLVDLEAQLVQAKQDRTTKISTANELKSFLKKFGYDSEDEIEKEIAKTKSTLEKATEAKQNLQKGYVSDTHVADESRTRLREIIIKIEKEENAVLDLDKRILEQEALRAELIATKFKMTRASSVSNILSGVTFQLCPCCGLPIKKGRNLPEGSCYLCGQEETESTDRNLDNAEIARLDIDARIKDIENSIDIHRSAYARQKKLLIKQIEYKKGLDLKLVEQLKSYESTFLANARQIDEKVATFKERLRGQNKLKEMPKEITKLLEDSDVLLGKEANLKRDIDTERAKLTESESFITDLETEFLQTLNTVGLPGVTEDDEVHINRKTWELFVYPNGEEYLKWNFFNAGSGGKKTLFNVCYLLSIHVVAARHNLPLPSFIIIDSPMKNIDKEVNEDLFKRFYDHLYSLAEGVLDRTQFIIIDNSYVSPKNDKLQFKDRYMTDNDDQHPPLISYYRGA
jgi:hypothetical protein